jgi:protein-tyrosine phosphatase
VAAAAEAGLDLRSHCSRRLTAELVESDGADLVIAMTRAHLREVVALDPGAWPRTFTLKELARRAAAVGPTGSFEEWRRAIAGDRKAAEMMQASDADDVADPHGSPYRLHQRMVGEVLALTATVAANWPP